LFGLNHTQVKNAVPKNQDRYGYTFFTRPQLCLSDYNLQNSRHFINMLADKDNAMMHHWIRNTLDPRIAHDLDYGRLIEGSDKAMHRKNPSPLVDPFNPFIPLLSNTLESLSGWPDITMPTFTSNAGVRKEQWIMADGDLSIYESYDLDATFNTVLGKPGQHLFSTWLRYMSNTFEGKMFPYIDFVLANEIDYMTRIYRLVIEKDGNKVTEIFANGASFPIIDPKGKVADFNSDHHFVNGDEQFSMRFKSIGAMYNDPILISEFNETVAIFNPDMAKLIRGEEEVNISVIQIPQEVKMEMNFRGYPYINPDTNVLEWYLSVNNVGDMQRLMNILSYKGLA
jgi:hypothetical protein